MKFYGLSVSLIVTYMLQFEDVCLDAALYLLDKAELSMGARSNAIHVTRTMSQMVRYLSLQ